MMDSVYKARDTFKYPQDNFETFEDFFVRTFRQKAEDRVFLPVAWTSFYRRAKYGKDPNLLAMLQRSLDKLDRSKKYFAVVTWDDGILNDISKLDIKVVAACGPRIDLAIPLLCQPHAYSNGVAKDIECSFVGALNHPIRTHLVRSLRSMQGYYISNIPHHMDKYCSILSRSKYVLCPRGYGMTSFRICEAIQYGATPIYVSDQFAFTAGTLKVEAEGNYVKTITEIVKQRFPVTNPSRLYNYEACKSFILQNISL